MTEFLELYGVITEILPDGEISVGEPVFTNPLTPKKYYRLLTEDVKATYGSGITRTYPVGLEEVNPSEYGSPVFLPAARKKVGDGKKYFVQFQPKKNATISDDEIFRCGRPVIYEIDTELFARRDYTTNILTVGVKFPDKFVAITNKWRGLEAGELARFIR